MVRWGALIAALIFLAVWSAGAAAADWLVGNGLAKHLYGGEHCNSVTTGLGLEHAAGEDGDARYSVGFYRNSNCKWSAYAARAWLYLSFADWHVGTIAGLVTGYGRPLTPAGGFVASYEPGRYGLNVVYVPPLQGSGNVLWLQAKWKF